MRKQNNKKKNKNTIIEDSAFQIQSKCEDFGNCGGCTYQNIEYAHELELKKSNVLELLKEAEITNFEFLGIEPSPSEINYRNKMEFSFGDNEKGGMLALGMRKRKSLYEVVTSENCNIVDDDFKNIVLCVLDFFRGTSETFCHKRTHEGTLRHLVIRKGFYTEEILVNIVTTSGLTSDLDILKQNILGLKSEGKLTGTIKGILHTKNDSLADVVKNDELQILYGENCFMEHLLGFEFKITAFSFFQTNSQGAERLYQTVIDFLNEKQAACKVIYDLYCGTGTISQLVSKNADKVIGVELVEEAIIAAKENAALNKITNCEFIPGDVLKVIDDLASPPDLIILDPPREGLHPKALAKIINYNVETIIYVSCNPTTLVRDLKILAENGYRIEKIKCHDLFPRTYHVETVVLLSKLKSTESIEVEINLDEMDLTTAESKATYDEVKQFVLENTGFKVSQLYIAQVKKKHGLIERINYNVGEGKSKVPQVPQDKEKAIEDALRHFKMI